MYMTSSLLWNIFCFYKAQQLQTIKTIVNRVLLFKKLLNNLSIISNNKKAKKAIYK